jgi:Flp pilus assembly protein TadB
LGLSGVTAGCYRWGVDRHTIAYALIAVLLFVAGLAIFVVRMNQREHRRKRRRKLPAARS